MMTQTSQMQHFVSHDNQQIPYQLFPARAQNGPAAAIVLLYRNADLKEKIAALGLPECTFFAIDFTPGTINAETPDGSSVLSLQSYYFQQFIEHITTQHGLRTQDIALMAHHECAVVIAAWMVDYAPEIRSVTLFSPRFLLRKRDLLLALLKKPKAWNTLRDLRYTSQRIFRSAFAWPTPTQLVLTQTDRRAAAATLMTFYANLGSSAKTVLMKPDSGFGCPGQLWDRAMLAQTRAFLRLHFSQHHPVPSLFDCWQQGATWEEYERLRMPEKGLLRRGYWMLANFALRALGHFSSGIRIGLETGFDSGASLEYVYQNQPTGKGAVGRAVDRYYLNTLGWRCTRQRKHHVEALIAMAASLLAQQGQMVRLLDIAAGQGRYILDAIEKIEPPVEHLLLRDFDAANVEEGNRLLLQRGLNERARFEQGDAFSPADLATLPADRTLAVVSGFYELFSDNNMVLASLNGLANAVKKGGYLVYTTKLWNPKLALMARVLPSHQKGAFWLLRRRAQREIDQMVKRAGFAKVTQRVDGWGLFSVTLAKKVR
ncbi:class I SAM-dependent methyltransferase family protein [Kosakonia cowanii]|uniref:class I SAM-dependent methyltransferase family protein n=1 Tax=Kosakonia cowanii TaxID=208223 RepID=UPI0028A97AC6|nr:class I SAM-dependent methyltransferase family protein [Kosakonia cowanii]